MNLLLLLCIAQVTVVSAAAMVLYLVASRRGPRVRAAVVVTAVFAIAAVSVLSVCPLPNWWRLLPDLTSATAIGDRTPLESNTCKEAMTTAPVSREHPDEASLRDVAEGTFPLLNPGLFRHRQTPSERAIAFRPLFHGWSRMLLPGVAVGVCVMLLRLAFGLRAVGRIRRQSRPLANDGVDEMMASLLRVAPWRHPVSVRQSDQVVTAATIGCFRPLIILPADWTDWTTDELHAVLAHEVSHICRRDYLTRLTAHVVAALHFYHPLIQWLTGRLVYEQEYASDSLAATLVGGRGRYLRALAKLALRQDDRRSERSLSFALPVSSRFLMRRIDMLQVKDGWQRDSVAGIHLWVCVFSLAVFSVGATAIRCVAQNRDEGGVQQAGNGIVEEADRPNAVGTSSRQDPASFSSNDLSQREPLDPSVFAREGTAVCVFRPAEFLRRVDMPSVTSQLNQSLLGWLTPSGTDDALTLKIEQIDQVAADVFVTCDNNGPTQQPHRFMVSSGRAMVRTTDPFDWNRFLQERFPDATAKDYRQREYLELPVIPQFGPVPLNAYIADDRTVVFASGEDLVHGVISSHLDGPPPYDRMDQWTALDGGVMTMAFDNRRCRWLQVKGIEDDQWKPMVAPLLDEATFVGVRTDWCAETNRFELRTRAVSDREGQSSQIKQSVETLLEVARLYVENNTSRDGSRGAMGAQVLSFLQSVSWQFEKTADGLPVIEGRMEGDAPIDGIRELMAAEDAG